MQSTHVSQPASLGWKLVILMPLAGAIALQVISHRQFDLHASIRLSIAGNLVLSLSLIAQSLYLMRKTTTWGIVLLIAFAAGLGFGFHALLRAL